MKKGNHLRYLIPNVKTNKSVLRETTTKVSIYYYAPNKILIPYSFKYIHYFHPIKNLRSDSLFPIHFKIMIVKKKHTER